VIRLGLRLALSDGRRSAISVALTAAAVAIGTAILLFAVSFQPALAGRDLRQAWRQPQWPVGAQPRLLMAAYEDRFAGQPFVRIFIAPLTADAPTPPGMTQLPGPGQAYVSPALAELLAHTPADELAPRVGRVVGTIGPEGLRSPQELVAVIGSDRSSLEGNGAAPVASFRVDSLPPDLPPIAILILVLAIVGALVPVAVFVATATSMAAARREQRLAALRLVGATPAQVAWLAMVEALLYTVIGAPLGVALFFLVRPWVALIPLDGATWWPDSIQPPLLQEVALLISVQVVGAAAALVGMRRLSVSPLGVQRRQAPPQPSALRIVPSLAGVAVLLAGIVVFRSNIASPGSLAVLGASFAAIIAGIVFAGPWLTFVVGRVLGRIARGPAALLAARRLADDPRGSFGAIAGVIMAVFVASAFFSLMGYARAASLSPEAPMRPGVVMTATALTPSGGHGSGDVLTARLTGLAGVRSVLPVREVVLTEGENVVLYAWIVPCDQLFDGADAGALQLPGAQCGGASVHTISSAAKVAGSTFTVSPAITSDTPSDSGTRPSFQLQIESGQVQSLVVGSTDRIRGLPDLLIDPGVLGTAADRFPITVLFANTDGTAAAAERVRAAIQGYEPLMPVYLADDPMDQVPQYAEVGRIVGLGLIGSLALAGCSLAVATITGLLGRRRQFALLRAAGMPISRLRVLVLLQAGVPLIAVSAASSLLGVIVAQGVLRVAYVGAVPLPDLSLVAVLGASLAVAMGVVAATLPAADRLTRPQSLRSE
jgi:hypothetical protein